MFTDDNTFFICKGNPFAWCVWDRGNPVITPPGAANPGAAMQRDFFLNQFQMNNNFDCLELISNMFHAWCLKSPMHEIYLRQQHAEMMLLVPRPFMFVMMDEIRELSSTMPNFQRSFMFAQTNFKYPINVTRDEPKDDPLLRINGVVVLPSFDMTLNLYHIETTERLDDWLRVSVPLMPGFKLDHRFPGTSAVMFKIDQALPLFPFDSSAKEKLN